MKRVSFALLAPALLAAAPAGAVTTRVFRQATAKDFEEGEAEGSLVLPTGEVAPGMKAARLGVEVAFAWCAAMAEDGSTAYFGTGDEGKIVAVDTRPGGKARVLAVLDAAWVTSLLARPDGTLLAGTTPGGRIYAVDPRTGGARVFALLAADHVWSLAYDRRTGTAYAGTGPEGKLFAVDASGKARLLWESGDKHVVSLGDGGDGTLLAGTADQAILYRVHRDGRAEALQDFDGEEVRAIATLGDSVYLAVNDFEKPPAAAAPAPARGTKVAAGPAPPAAGAARQPGQVKAKGGVYRLDRDGRIEQVHALADGYYTSLIVDGKGTLHAATGTQGKVYRIERDGTAALAIDLPERQALALLPERDGFLVGTGDVGGIYRARPAAAKDATYLSKVLDAEAPARWGLLRWHGSEGLSFETRSGNTTKPGAAWTAWKPLAGVRPSLEGGVGRVASRGARYLQYRVTLGAGGAMREVELYYLPINQRSRVTDFSVNDGAAPVGGAAGAPVQRAHSPVAKLRWKVENPDGDDLVYRLSYRPDGEVPWRPLAPDPLTKPEFDWNTESVPDGLYLVRVTVSDERSNPRERALESTFVSPPLLVDNRKPEVAGLEVRGEVVAGRARDDASPITAIEYAVDGGDFLPAAPTDGILDDLVEPFSLRLPQLAPGPHVVVVRAWDGADNVGAAQVTVRAR